MSLRDAKLTIIYRVIAKALDLMVFMALGVFIPQPFGVIAGFFYTLVADGMMIRPFQGQSIGKKIFRFQVLQTHTRTPCSLKQSIIRNTPVGVATFFALIPFLGWVIVGLVGVPLMLLEVYIMLTVGKGRRLGDLMADTEVVECQRRST